jgi:hypothetical protein
MAPRIPRIMMSALGLFVAAAGADLRPGAPLPLSVVRDGAGVVRPLEDFRGKKMVLVGAGRWAAVREAEEPLRRSKAVLLSAGELDEDTMCLADEGGIVRRREAVASSAARLVDWVAEWEEGRAVFANRCSRRHGKDGMDSHYPYVRLLGGIGTRHTAAEIREKQRPTVVGPHYVLVRGEPCTAKQIDAIVAYLGGL